MRSKFPSVLWVLLVLLSLLKPVLAEETPIDFGKDTLRMVNANRSLLAQAEAAYEKIKAEYAKTPTGSLKRELEKAQYKIKALTEDSAKLLEKLPEETKADELVKYVLMTDNAKKQAVAETTLEDLDTKVKAFDAETEKYYKMHEQALELAAANQYEKAIKVYEDIILMYPEDDQAFMIMGHLHMMLGQFERAEKVFYNAAQLDPENIQQITPFYENQILKNPEDDTAYMNLGYIYLMFKDTASAEGAFQDALSINPDNTLAKSGLGIVMDLNQSNL